MSHICPEILFYVFFFNFPACLPACTASLPAYDLVSLPLSPSVAYSPSSSASQYALVYKGFSLHQDDLLYWQLPAQFTGDKVTVESLR